MVRACFQLSIIVTLEAEWKQLLSAEWIVWRRLLQAKARKVPPQAQSVNRFWKVGPLFVPGLNLLFGKRFHPLLSPTFDGNGAAGNYRKGRGSRPEQRENAICNNASTIFGSDLSRQKRCRACGIAAQQLA